ncbi:tachykinins [Chelonus insularis]|uniref:tachykinins n=1 Tax=Chelonus insularis TaxID=460826 RepID=UPI00158F2575|nr:tachykinins [Chelonus insularis]XP_034935182.1 tachykinins [Chelonus insularis]
MFINLIALAIFSIILQSLAEESILNGVEPNKRAPMGFQGMRGKKDIISDLDDNDLSKRAPMGFQGMRGKKDSDVSDLNEFFDDYEKRGPMGFQGMRGKKDDFLAPEDFDEGYYHDDYEKRALMGFQGMRGKKAMRGDEFYKRAIGFQPTRGKKSFDEILDEYEKRGNFPVIPNKLYMNDYPDEYGKRVSALGFQSMRGKKDEYENVNWNKRAMMELEGKQNFLEELEDLEKRAIMGFQGMRGKKDGLTNYYEYIVDPADYEKRAPMGFQGMRGKRGDDKRGNMGFIGMRGKRNVMGLYDMNDGYYENSKNLIDSRFINNAMQFEKRPAYGISGTRGKKIPRWEIRGKFVGVRGKKNGLIDPKFNPQ